MESYEKIRKMGEISKQLKQHGLAEDNLNAQKEAEKIMGKDNEFYVSQDEINKIKEQDQKEKEKQEEEKSKCNPVLIDNLNTKISSMESMMNSMRDKMNEMISKINELEGKVNVQPRQEVQATLNASTENKEQNTNNTSATPSTPKEEKDQLNKEVKGEYSPDDVSVDKIFYAGNK